jgi:hypothetical protein
MTRRSSLRAQAQEIYREMTAQLLPASRQTPLIPAQAGIHDDCATPADGGPGSLLARGRTEENSSAQSLTEKVRALYENSAVPVAEIARLAGVTERTLYKYARKDGWKPRYAWIDRGGVKARRGWRANEGFDPAKGAGARFIARADKDKPYAAGLKAVDPEGAARAASACGEAAVLSGQAQCEVEAAQRCEKLIKAIEWNGTALRNLREFDQRRDKARPGPFDGRQEDILFRIATMALARWEALLAEEEGATLAACPGCVAVRNEVE